MTIDISSKLGYGFLKTKYYINSFSHELYNFYGYFTFEESDDLEEDLIQILDTLNLR